MESRHSHQCVWPRPIKLSVDFADTLAPVSIDETIAGFPACRILPVSRRNNRLGPRLARTGLSGSENAQRRSPFRRWNFSRATQLAMQKLFYVSAGAPLDSVGL
jgi:hypothetical protein